MPLRFYKLLLLFILEVWTSLYSLQNKCSGVWMLSKNSTWWMFIWTWFESYKLQLVSIKPLISWLIQNWKFCSLENGCSRKQCSCPCSLCIWLVYIELNTLHTQQNCTLPYQQWPDNCSGSAGWKSMGHGNLTMDEEWGKKCYCFLRFIFSVIDVFVVCPKLIDF